MPTVLVSFSEGWHRESQVDKAMILLPEKKGRIHCKTANKHKMEKHLQRIQEKRNIKDIWQVEPH